MSKSEKYAKRLDRITPGWHERVDVHRLDFRSDHDCVLGQVYGTYVSSESRGVFLSERFNKGGILGLLTSLIIVPGFINSFCAWTPNGREKLRLDWTDSINSRKGATARREETKSKDRELVGVL